MWRAGRIVFGVVLVGVSAALFFSAAKVALPSRPGTSERLAWARPVSSPISQADLDQLFTEELVTVVGPAGSHPEELVQTILEDATLPSHIRAPFVVLARAKAPQLLRRAVR